MGITLTDSDTRSASIQGATPLAVKILLVYYRPHIKSPQAGKVKGSFGMDNIKTTIGGLLVASLGWLAKHFELKLRKPDKENPTVRDWKTTQHDMREAMGQMKSSFHASFSRMESILIEADIPRLHSTLAIQGAEINVIKVTQVESRKDLANIKAEQEEQSGRIARLTKRVESLESESSE